MHIRSELKTSSVHSPAAPMPTQKSLPIRQSHLLKSTAESILLMQLPPGMPSYKKVHNSCESPPASDYAESYDISYEGQTEPYVGSASYADENHS